jgi:hypothetical protein
MTSRVRNVSQPRWSHKQWKITPINSVLVLHAVSVKNVAYKKASTPDNGRKLFKNLLTSVLL